MTVWNYWRQERVGCIAHVDCDWECSVVHWLGTVGPEVRTVCEVYHTGTQPTVGNGLFTTQSLLHDVLLEYNYICSS